MNRLRQALRERRMSAEELAQAVGMKGAAIRRYVRGEIQPTIELAARIAAALEMDEGELWGVASATSPATGRTVPVYGAAAAGLGEDISDVSSPLEYQPAPPPVRGAGYGVIVAGDSMSPRLQTADVVFASPGNPLRPGDLVVVQYKIQARRDARNSEAVLLVVRGKARSRAAQHSEKNHARACRRPARR
jgi:phage repressor protein C with HTH and peptisase S24 domain